MAIVYESNQIFWFWKCNCKLSISIETKHKHRDLLRTGGSLHWFAYEVFAYFICIFLSLFVYLYVRATSGTMFV